MYQKCVPGSLSLLGRRLGVTSVAVVSARTESSTPRWALRLLWAGLALGAFTVLALARWLTPDPSGFGTHLQLGLPPCGFRYFTSLPCPACGLTTAFAHMARLEITSAVHAHPLGLPLFLCTLFALPRCLLASLRAEAFADTLMRLRAGPLAAMMALSALLSWVARIAGIFLA